MNNKNLNNKKDPNSKVLLLIKSDKRLNKKKDWKEKREKIKWPKINTLKMPSKESSVKIMSHKQIKCLVIVATKRKTEWTLKTLNLVTNGDL